jgi:gluconokinase
VLDAIGVSTSTLAPVEDGPRDELSSGYRDRWPGLDGVPWFPGLGDGACAVVGSGYGRGRAALTVGTSAAVRVLSSGEGGDRPAALFAYLLDPARSVVGVARSNAGSLEAWARRVLRVDGEDPVGAATAGRRPGGHGLEVVSSLGGERSPRWPLDATGLISRVRLATTTLDVLQALVEDAVLGLVESLEILEAWAGPLTLVLSGGAVASAGWRRLLADATGRELVCCRVGEVSARGAALAALGRLGAADPEAVGPADGEVIRPDEARSETFAALRAARSSQE